MVVSYKWLQEYFKKDLPAPSELGGILNTRAYEVEKIEEKNGDTLIDIDVLPNRAHDSLCHLGIAREISTLTGLEISEPKIEDSSELVSAGIEVKIETENCRRYIAREIKNVVVEDSSDELRLKVEAMGGKSINNIVDITNVVMFELGQPMHAFDLDKIAGEKIIVRQASAGERLTTLDKKEVELGLDDMVIASEASALAIAGVKGGNKAEVVSGTKNIVLESANFHPRAVRKTSQKIDIVTDSSKRFENEITPELADKAVMRATELILKYASASASGKGGDTEVAEMVDAYPKKTRHKYMTGVSLEEVNSLLGIKLREKEVEDIFDRLKFEYKKVKAKDNFVKTLEGVVGTPYKYGAGVLNDAPDAFDCSSLSAYGATQSGKSIPRISIDQLVYSREIKEKDLERGDIVFSNQHIKNNSNQEKFKDRPEIQAMIDSEHNVSKQFMPGTKIEKAIDHLGVYLGDGKVLFCTSIEKKGTVIEDLAESKHFEDVVAYGRIFEKDEERYVVTIPNERLDLRIKEDLIEEIARVYGYENIPDTPTKADFKPEINKEYYYNNLIRKTLSDIGFSEVMTSSFSSKGDVEVAKPFDQTKPFLRTSLVPNLANVFKMNENNKDLLGLDKVKIFEIGKVFIGKGKERKEELMLGVVGAGQDDFDKLGEVLKVDLGKVISQDEMAEAINLGYLYENLRAPSEYVELPELLDKKFKAFSEYPYVLRDIAVWIPTEVDEDDLVSLIKENAGELLVTEPKQFDRFEKEGRVSYAYRLVFQSYEKTLTDEGVNVVMDKITGEVSSKGWEVR